MDEDRLKDLVTAHIDQNIQKLNEALKNRGSDFSEIQQKRDSVEIGVFAKSADYDFYVLENVGVVIKGFRFPIQTTYILDGQTSVENGLWFPLKVNDRGRKKPCELKRISVQDGQQIPRPEVNLVIGVPARVMVSRLIEVVDLSSDPPSNPEAAHAETAPAPVTTAPVTTAVAPTNPAPEEKPKQATEADEQQAREEKRAKSRAEDRRERRERREKRRRERREEREARRRERHSRRHRSSRREEVQKTSDTPADNSSNCTGDLSPWKSIACKLTGK